MKLSSNQWKERLLWQKGGRNGWFVNVLLTGTWQIPKSYSWVSRFPLGDVTKSIVLWPTWTKGVDSKVCDNDSWTEGVYWVFCVIKGQQLTDPGHVSPRKHWSSPRLQLCHVTNYIIYVTAFWGHTFFMSGPICFNIFLTLVFLRSLYDSMMLISYIWLMKKPVSREFTMLSPWLICGGGRIWK